MAGREEVIYTVNMIQQRSGADSRSPISLSGTLGGSVSFPGLLMVLDVVAEDASNGSGMGPCPK